MTITVGDYVSSFDLDAELASLGYTAMRGSAGQRPLTGSVIRSLYRPTGMTATTLAVQRDDDGRLVGAAALRWPATLAAAGRIWGPAVLPNARGRGLGRKLVSALGEVAASHPGVRFTTSDLPESGRAAWSLFEGLGWRPEPSSTLLARALPARLPVPTAISVRPAKQGEYLHAVLAELFAACRPDLCYSIARDTFARWSGDTRYTPAGLLLSESEEGLAGAVLVYPSRLDNGDEPAEARIADLMICQKLPPDAASRVRTTLVAAALRMADQAGAEVARIVARCPELQETLRCAGFEPVDQIRHYTLAN